MSIVFSQCTGPVSIASMPRLWLSVVEPLCEPQDCHSNAAHAALELIATGEISEATLVTGLARDPGGFVYDHTWLRIAGVHYDPTAELYWPEEARADVELVPVLERPAERPPREFSLNKALYEALTNRERVPQRGVELQSGGLLG